MTGSAKKAAVCHPEFPLGGTKDFGILPPFTPQNDWPELGFRMGIS